MSRDTLLEALHTSYPRPRCALVHNGPFQLLIATILSAQCTDERVNQVTAVLFKKYPSPDKLGSASLPEVEKVIRSTGFFRQKAKSIVMTSRFLVERHGGQVPPDMDQLLALRGVARKTANVVLGTGFGVAAGIVVDTHVKRLARRLGLTRQTDPVKIERDLMKKIPQKEWMWFSHALIAHGRAVCSALRPRCDICPVRALCPSAGTL